MVGTQDYISPEGLKGQSSMIGFGADLWTLGVMIWQIFSDSNLTPFAAKTQEETFIKVQLCDYAMPEGPHVTDDVKSLIASLLTREPSERLGANDI
jgi:serine/threonine protein kinase